MSEKNPIQEKQQKQFRSFTSEQLLNTEFKEPEFVVDGLIPSGLVFLPAKPKTGKSWLALDLADSVANGKDFWGRHTNQGAAMYLALEDNEPRLKKRMIKLGIEPNNNLQFTIRDVCSIKTGLIEQITSWAQSVSTPRLLIIDTIQRVRDINGKRIDMYSEDTSLYAPLQEAAMKLGICILCVTHYNKGGRYSSDDVFERMQGSTGVFGVADAILAIVGKRDDAEKTLAVTGRDVEFCSYKIKFNENTCHWEMLGDEEEVQRQRKISAYRNGPIRKTLLKILSETHTWTGSATELLSIIQNQEHCFYDSDAKALGKKIADAQKMLEYIDRITFTQGEGGSKNRFYTFYIK